MRKLVIASVLMVMMAGCGDSKSSKSNSAELQEIKLNRLAREFVQGSIKDPSSAQFRNQSGVCGEVNSKNSFGAYAGFQRFIATSREMVIFERDSGLDANTFNDVWNKGCLEGGAFARKR